MLFPQSSQFIDGWQTTHPFYSIYKPVLSSLRSDRRWLGCGFPGFKEALQTVRYHLSCLLTGDLYLQVHNVPYLTLITLILHSVSGCMCVCEWVSVRVLDGFWHPLHMTSRETPRRFPSEKKCIPLSYLQPSMCQRAILVAHTAPCASPKEGRKEGRQARRHSSGPPSRRAGG